MTVIDETAPPKDAGIKRDKWGRYLLPDPNTGEVRSWTRVTTLSGTLADRYGLEKWAQRNLVLGIGARRDLYAQATAATEDDYKTLTSIVDQALEAARSKAGANMGSALHRLTERVDAGQLEVGDIADPQLRADVQAYRATMAAAGIQVLWTEQVLLIPELGLAGTCDRLVNGMWALPRIGDIKTGKDVVKWGMAEIPLQLACYAHATHWYDTTTGDLNPMPKVDLDVGIVMHLPAGKAHCFLYEVDIRAGWEAVQLAVAVRAWRQRNGLAQLLPAMGEQAAKPLSVPATTKRVEWIRAWIKACSDHDHLALVWPIGVPVPRSEGWRKWTDGDIDKIADVCQKVDAANGAPFWPPDPTSNDKGRLK